MTLIQLKYVLAVAEYRNFTLAAEKTFVTQPTLSMQIQKLEQELGVEIFDRSIHPIAITITGEKIVKQAMEVLRQAKQLEQMVEEERNLMEGDFSIGIIPTVLPTLVPLFLKTFQKKFPKINLSIYELKTKDIIEQTTNGLLDFGILVTPLENESIIEEPLYYEPFVAYIPQNHRLSSKNEINAKDLDISDMLLMEEGHCFRNNVLSICTQNNRIEKGVKVESGNFGALLKLVKEGYGMTLLPSLHAEDLSKEENIFIKRFSAPEPTREVSLVFHKSQIRLSFMKELKSLIKGILRGKIYFESDNVTSPKITLS